LQTQHLEPISVSDGHNKVDAHQERTGGWLIAEAAADRRNLAAALRNLVAAVADIRVGIVESRASSDTADETGGPQLRFRPRPWRPLRTKPAKPRSLRHPLRRFARSSALAHRRAVWPSDYCLQFRPGSLCSLNRRPVAALLRLAADRDQRRRTTQRQPQRASML
jgi:hypothetical protein